MKMSKVFELPVEAESFGGRLYYNNRENPAFFSHVEQTKAVAHAINNHDKLIDLLKQAVGRVVISTADQDELQWFIEVMDVLEGEL